MNFVIPDSKRWGTKGGGIRWGILCTDPNDGRQSLLLADRRHFYIADYKKEALLSLSDPDNVWPHNRKLFKMKVVKLQESYALLS